MATSTIPEIPGTGGLPAANDFFETGGATLGSLKVPCPNYPQKVATLTALAALSITTAADGVAVIALGGAVVRDGGGGIFVYDSTSTATPNGTTVIAPAVGSGRWLIAISGYALAGAVLLKANSLGDLPNAGAARVNLGLGTAATRDIGTTAGTAAAGDDARIVGAAQKSSNLYDLTNKQNAKFNLGFSEVNVWDYGADYSGNIDATTAIQDAIAAAQLLSDGTVKSLILNSYVGGFGAPSNAWTGRPSITLSGGLNGSTGFQAYGNVNTDGFMCNIEVATIGTGYLVKKYLINRTNGTAVITLSSGTFDARLVAGVTVRHESLTQSCTILSRDSATQLTLSENNSFTNSDYFVFGIPVVRVNGTPAYDNLIPICGQQVTLMFPPGRYLLPNGFPTLAGLTNVTVMAVGVEFIFTAVTGCTSSIRNSVGVDWFGGKFKYVGARYQVPAAAFRSTRYPGQVGFSVNCCQQVTVNGVDVFDAFMFGFAVAGDGRTGRWLCNRIFFNDCQAIDSLGDGFHVSGGSKYVRVNRCEVLAPGDDALAVVNDGNPAQRPTDVIFSNCNVEGGIYRGCVAIGADFVEFRNIYGKNTHGPFCWAGADGGVTAPTNCIFDGIVADELGNTVQSISDTNSGIGFTSDGVTNLTIRGCRFAQSATVAGANPIWNINVGGTTNLNWDEQAITSTGSVGTLGGSLNSDLDCQVGNGFAGVTLGVGRWLVTGTIASRSATGSGVVIWPTLWDGTNTYGAGASFQTGDLTLRANLGASAIVEVNSGTKAIRFRLKQGGGGVTIDAGSTAGPNSYLQAVRI